MWGTVVAIALKETMLRASTPPKTTLTRLTAVGLNANGNTTPTNLAKGTVQMLGCNGVTL